MNNSSEFEEVDLLFKKARIAQEKFEQKADGIYLSGWLLS